MDIETETPRMWPLFHSNPFPMQGKHIAALTVAASFLTVTGITVALAQVNEPPPPPPLPAGCFLKIEGIDGERTGGAIEIESWSWGESNPIRSGGGGGGAGKVSMQDFHFVKKVDVSSPKLFLATAMGEHIKSAELTCRKAGEQPQEYLKWTLSDILVTSYQTNGSGHGDAVPTDSFSLNFTKIEFDYTPQNSDGTTGSPVHGGWDLKKNQKI